MTETLSAYVPNGFWTEPCRSLKGVGDKTALKLQNLNLLTLCDVLFHFPVRYQDRTKITPINDLSVDGFAVVEGILEKQYTTRHKRMVWHGQVSDGTGSLNIQFFHFSAAQMQRLQIGQRVRVLGDVKKLKNRKQLAMVHPEYLILEQGDSPPLEKTLTPIYSTTEGVSQNLLRKITDQAITKLKQHALTDAANHLNFLSKTLCEQFDLYDPIDALITLHRPTMPNGKAQSLESELNRARQRFVFEELLAHQLRLSHHRAQRQALSAKKLCRQSSSTRSKLQQQCLAQLSFELTGAQTRVLQDIEKDLSRSSPMMRLVQGDVGSGKTLVALLSALHAIEHGYQACLLAPTEMLAIQHYHNAQKLFDPLGIQTTFLSGALNEKDKAQAYQFIESGAAQFVVGTHALFQNAVRFHQLALVIIDEQHRFGVAQQQKLLDKGRYNQQHPHQLVMSATPIPRTLAMTLHADLDISTVDELPPGRTPITTVVLPNHRRAEVITRIEQVCKAGRQAYWVCTLIDDSDTLQAQAAEAAAEALQPQLSSLCVGLVHGRMKAEEKAAQMQAFKAGELQVLVATTVIEVGVDVPNASLMVIENPERLGLAQLHQLRGRVGRGRVESYCVLLYQSPLNSIAEQRLSLLRSSVDGFDIARKDLEMRGPGDIMGTRQTGAIAFRLVDWAVDHAMLPKVQRAAAMMETSDEPGIRALIRRWS